MHFISLSKFRLLIILAFCILIWKTFYYFAHVRTTKYHQVISNVTFDKIINLEHSAKPVVVSVYYEALCSDSRNFILKQLLPTYEKLSNEIQLDLIPYGKAMTFEKDGTYEFKCQHSHLECEANKIHACVLKQPMSESAHLNFVACLFRDNSLPQESGQRCAEELGVDYDPIDKCSKSREGSQLLKEHGDRTNAITPKITFIPTIQLNKSSQVPLVLLLKNLHKQITKILEQKS